MNRNTLLKSIFALVLLAMLPSMTTAATETITWIHTDHLGSPIAGRNDAGETTWEQAYAPWGEKQAVAGAPQAPAGVGYTGHVYDEQVGLIYAGARWYDPAMGRLLSPDAVRFKQGNFHSFSRYAYAGSSPVMYVDPDGREFVLGAAIYGFIAADVAVPEPTDAAWPKWVLYGSAIAVGSMLGYDSSEGSIAKAESNQGEKEKKGQGQPEVGSCPDCGGSTSSNDGKIARDHGLSRGEVKDRIHGLKSGGKFGDNPDVEVCSSCGEVFPQTSKGGLGDSIGNINDGF